MPAVGSCAAAIGPSNGKRARVRICVRPTAHIIGSDLNKDVILDRGDMETIVVVPRVDRQIGYELGECMACLANARVRDYTARLEGSIVFLGI
jgi:hypothetical protein